MSVLSAVQRSVAERMQQITDLFKPGAKITVLVRYPDLPDRDFMMTDDEPAEAIKMIERRLKGVKQ